MTLRLQRSEAGRTLGVKGQRLSDLSLPVLPLETEGTKRTLSCNCFPSRTRERTTSDPGRPTMGTSNHVRCGWRRRGDGLPCEP